MSALDRWLAEGWLRPVDFALADSLRRLRPGTEDAVTLAAAMASHALAFGHGLLPLSHVAGLCLEIDAERPPPVMPALDGWLDALRSSPWVLAPDKAVTDNGPLVLDGGNVYLRRYWQHEHRLALSLRARASAPVPTRDAGYGAWRDARLATLFPSLAANPDDAQAAAACALPDTRLLLLTGGPGTGKTTTVARALVLALETAQRQGAALRIGLAAPTGKAAARLAESLRENLVALQAAGTVEATTRDALPTSASTLHRLLGWRPGGGFRHDAANPLPLDLLVVDEASMVDLPLMARLLDAVPPQATLLLVGDPDQLPSVDTGDVLSALCAPGSLLARVHLRTVYRQAQGHALATVAADIRDGRADAVLDALRDAGQPGLRWLPGTDRGLPAAALAAALPAYRAVQQAADPADALERAKRFRLLTALRDGPSGSIELNARIADALRPVGERDQRLFAGALLMITSNSPRHGLFNGDIGVAWPDEQGQLRVWFDAGDSDGPRAWLPAALPAHEFAFALTVHKSQGSEFGEVFLALPERGARVLSRELLYTGLTRCRRGVTLWASEAALREGIGRGAQRWSGLAQRLR